MRAAVLRRVRPIVDAQLGVVTAAQLREAGVDLEVPRRERWTRLAHGLWVVHDEPTDEQLLVALGLYSLTALASGSLACRWTGLRHPPAGTGLHGLAPHGTTLLGGPLLHLHQTRRMPERVERNGRSLAAAVRAVADAARWTPRLRDARAVVLAALADRHVALDPLREEAALGDRRAGTHLLRAITDWERGARSAPEAEAADALLDLAGVLPPPAFLLNPEVRLDGVLLGSPDGLMVDAGLGWEMDSVEYHGTGVSLDATLQRHRVFADAGIELLHATPSRLRADRAAWSRDVAERARARNGSYQPRPGLVVVPKGPVLGGLRSLAA